jgi:hypothetical protein
MKYALLICGALTTGAVSAASINRVHEPIVLAEFTQGSSTLRFEQIDDKVLLLTERGTDNSSVLTPLMDYAQSKSIHLCPAQIYGLLSTQLIPKALWRACADPQAAKQLRTLQADAKIFRIFESPITTIGSYCVGATGYQTFRTNECNPELSDLYDDVFYDSDHSYWCANTLRQSTDRIMSSQLGDEGEVASIRAVSCSGNTRFRYYKRDSTGDSWSLYRDYQLGASERISLYSYDLDSTGDSDFRFRMDSSSGAWHRNTGYFIDD